MPVLIMGIVLAAMDWFARKKPELWWLLKIQRGLGCGA